MSSMPDNLGESVKLLARRGDARAIERLFAGSDARHAAEALAGAQRDLYWTHKDIPAMVTVSRVGIGYLLKSADPSTHAQAADVRHEAKAMAYDLASFTWPGWNEPGITLSAADVAAGFEAAKLNLRLAEELHKPEQAKARAYWLLAAHQLVAGEFGWASDSLRAGKTHADRAGDPLLGQVLDGYLRLALLLSEPQSDEARHAFDSAVSSLKDHGSEDARDYADQLTTALTVLENRRTP